MLIADRGPAFIGSSGSWRKIYRGIFFASVLYSFASEALECRHRARRLKTGGIYDLPFLASASPFWGCSRRQRYLHGIEAMLPAPSPGAGPPRCWQNGAVFSAPLGYWALFLSHEPLYSANPFCGDDDRRRGPGLFCFSQATLAGPKLLQLLQHSRESFDNLQRLQGRVIQQAKLASLENSSRSPPASLDHPLSAILSNSERMAASSSLSREQLATAQKIGQQAAEPANSSTIAEFRPADSGRKIRSN